jgi:hypothetical protein
METLSFTHVFSRELRCTLTASASPPPPGLLRQVSCEWVGQPKPKHFGQYRRWILTVYRTLADRWNQEILYGLGISPRETELWEFAPGQAPKLIAKIPFGIP